MLQEINSSESSTELEFDDFLAVMTRKINPDGDNNQESNRRAKGKSGPRKIKKLIASMNLRNVKLGGVLTPLYQGKKAADNDGEWKE